MITFMLIFLAQIFDYLDSFGVTLLSLSLVQLGLARSEQASSCFRTVAFRSLWQFKIYLHLLSGPNVCKCLRPTQWLVEILGTCPVVGIS